MEETAEGQEEGREQEQAEEQVERQVAEWARLLRLGQWICQRCVHTCVGGPCVRFVSPSWSALLAVFFRV